MPTVSRSCLSCALHGSRYFCSLTLEALTALDSIGTSVTRQAGDTILHEGFSADRVYIVCQGRIKLTASSPQGRLLILRVAGPGDVLGLASVLRGAQYRISASALEPCELKSVRRSEFLHLMDRFHDASRNAAAAIATEYEGAVLSARRLALSSSAGGKLASVLLDWGRMDREHTCTSLTFSMPLTHEELGSMAGLSRETVTRLLGRFRREGLIEQHGVRMTLPSPARLEALYT